MRGMSPDVILWVTQAFFLLIFHNATKRNQINKIIEMQGEDQFSEEFSKPACT